MLVKEANRKSQKLLLLVKMGAKHGGVPIHLKRVAFLTIESELQAKMREKKMKQRGGN